MKLDSVTLEGKYVRLIPLSLGHLDELWNIAQDAELWKWTVTQIHSRQNMEKYIDTALDLRQTNAAIPFTILLKPEEIPDSKPQVVGCTRFANIDVHNRHVEIGWTWVGKKWQRTAVNTEAKYLLLRHAFEEMKCVRVEFKTDALNDQSRTAILRLGAKEEGIFRQHSFTVSGRLRDSVYFSIIDSEWASVKSNLEKKMPRRHP